MAHKIVHLPSRRAMLWIVLVGLAAAASWLAVTTAVTWITQD
ncbi:MAG: hypothetical protein ABIQ33_01565 [Caldimonas sp.]